MVSYRLDGMAGVRTQPLRHGAVPATRTIVDYIAEMRASANDYQHPVVVFDLDGQPVFRNSALAARLTAEQQSASADRTWQQVCATACRIVADSIVNRAGVSAVVPVQQRSFAILSSLLRQPTGTVYGAIVHLSEVSGGSRGSASAADSGDSHSSVNADDYRAWAHRHHEARSKMQRLSPRETEVVSRVSEGLPNKSIARELEISVKTIEKHRANAVRKLGVASTPEMVRIAVLAESAGESAPDIVATGASPDAALPLRFPMA